MVTAARFAKGMTFPDYVRFIGTPENLAREASMGRPRRDWTDFFRKAYESVHLTEAQVRAWKWLAARPGGPAKVLVIAEEWSSDCRRDVPSLAKIADVAGLDLRIFTRDGRKFSASPRPDPAQSPTADLMGQFLNEKNGQTWQSIPVVVFFDRDMAYLCHYVEYPGMYHKDRLLAALRAPKPGETADQTRERGDRDFTAMQQSPFFAVWACAAIDEMLSMLYERLVAGAPA